MESGHGAKRKVQRYVAMLANAMPASAQLTSTDDPFLAKSSYKAAWMASTRTPAS